MAIAGVTDIITHFIGYLHLDLEPERDWNYPDGAPVRTINIDDDGRTFHQPTLQDNQADSAGLTPGQLVNPASFDDSHFSHALARHLAAPIKLAPLPPLKFTPLAHQPPSDDASASNDDGSATYYNPGGVTDETVFDVHQSNTMSSNDHFGLATDGQLPAIEQGLSFNTLIHISDRLGTDDLPPIDGNASQEVSAIKIYDAEWDHGETPPHSAIAMETGRYVDGTMLTGDQATDGSPDAISSPYQAQPDYTLGVHNMPLGVQIDLGSNIVANTAEIIDTSSARLSSIIMGDYYHSNYIVQTNVMQNLDWLSAETGGQNSQVDTNVPDHISNIANFMSSPYLSSSTDFTSVGGNVTVTVAHGDFYDINLVTQTNYITDNDVYIGAPTINHVVAILGENEQINVATMDHLGPTTDLLIVLGNYHSANVIYQQNVLMNDDALSVTGNGGHESIVAGSNSLTNDASIVDLGTTDFTKSDGAVATVVHDILTTGNASAAELDALVPGNGTGDFNIMVVTGDYYALNVIGQQNIVSDNNQAVLDASQVQGAAPLTVISGNDTLANSATIVGVGTIGPAQYLGGTAYSDSTLVQASLVDTNHAAPPSADTIVPEAVAFLTNDHSGTDLGSVDLQPPPSSVAQAPSHQDILTT